MFVVDNVVQIFMFGYSSVFAFTQVNRKLTVQLKVLFVVHRFDLRQICSLSMRVCLILVLL